MARSLLPQLLKGSDVDPDVKGWKIKREFSVGDLLAIVFAGASILLAYGKLDTRTALLEDFRRAQEQRDSGQDVALHTAVGEVNVRLTRIEDKADLLLQRRPR